MDKDEEIMPWEEAPVATGPMKSSYSPGEEQAQRMEGHLGPELNRRLEIMAAKLEVIQRVRDWIDSQGMGYHVSSLKLFNILDRLAQEIKAELK